MTSLVGNNSHSAKLSDEFAQRQHIYDLPIGMKTSSVFDVPSSAGGTNLEENRPYCRGLYEFRSELPNELGFSAGEIIFLEKRKNSEWLEGECQSNGRRGIFPQGFVDIVVPLRSEETMPTHLPVPLSSFTIEDDSNDQIGVASALYDFQPRFPDELPLRAGESVKVLELVGSEWVKCRDPTSGMVGIVPQCFLHVFFDTATDDPNKFGESPSSEADFCGGIERQSEARPWDVPLFQSLPFSDTQKPTLSSAYSSVADSASLPWVGSAGGAFFHRPPPRPPPPKMCSATEILPPINQAKTMPKTNSSKVSSSSSIFSTKSSSEKTSSSSLLRTNQPKVKSSKRQSLQQQQEVAYEDSVVRAGQEARGVQLVSQSGNPYLPMQNATSRSDAKQKVVLDLLNTERTYLFDLNAWEMSIHESAELSTEDKKALTNGYSPLKQLSQTLISAIMAQKDIPATDQHFGDIFMELKDKFFAAYAYHFRYVEQISAIVENEEEEALQKALQKCLLVMRQRGSNVFDVPSAVSRPIQRCLKYPLYVGELLKNTPIHHSDHPKLMESLRQFGTLASRMNECKRRKELIRKYRAQEQLSLADRLSRINMHSLVKKSNRLKYRINRSIGLNSARYSEFDYLVQLLEEAERRLCKFLYCAQLYKKHIEQSLKRYEDSYKGVCPAQDENVVKAFAVMFRRLDELCRRHLQAFDQEVLTEGKKLVRSDLAKLVHKRFDKLADYETAKATHKNSDHEEVDMRRAEFEALNNQIKAQLPRVIGTINARVLELIQRVNEFDADFLGRMDEWYARERPEKVRDCFSAALPFRAHLTTSHRHTLAELNKIAAHLSAGTTANPSNRRKSLRLSFRGAKPNHRHNECEAQQKMQKRRPQTLKERDALAKICHAQKQTHQLRRVQLDWENASMVLKQGDTVVVKAHHQDGLSLCDNAVTTGLVPVALLDPFDNSFTAPFLSMGPIAENESHKSKLAADNESGQMQPNSFEGPLLLLDFTAPNGISNSQRNGQTNRLLNQSNFQTDKFAKSEDVNLIDLEDNLIELDSPPKIDVYPRELKPISNCLGDRTDNAQLLSANYGQEASVKIGRSPPPTPSIPDRPSSSSHDRPSLPTPILSSTSLTDLVSSLSSIQPIRIAPPPPLVSQRHDITPQRQAVPGPNEKLQIQLSTQSSCNNGVYHPDNISTQFQPHSFAVCVYAFTPEHGNECYLEGNQLTIMEGEVVEIIRKHDDGGNSEWWLVRKVGEQKHGSDRRQGYVPSNYLSCLRTPMNTRV